MCKHSKAGGEESLRILISYYVFVFHITYTNKWLKALILSVIQTFWLFEFFVVLLRVDHMWQSRVETEGYSVAYFDRIAAFKALYH